MTGDIGRQGSLGVPHLLVYGATEDLQHVIAPSLEDAMVYAEYLANEKDEQSFRIFELREVEMSVKHYYQVKLLGDDAPPVDEETSGIVAPPVAELRSAPEADRRAAASRVADGSVNGSAGVAAAAAAVTGEIAGEPGPLQDPVTIVELDEMAATVAPRVGGDHRDGPLPVVDYVGFDAPPPASARLGAVAADDGAFEDGAFDDGAFEDGAFEDGAAEDGTFDDGAFEDGAAEDGADDPSADLAAGADPAEDDGARPKVIRISA